MINVSMQGCRSIIFDCDGVILQSNKLKSDAFGKVLEQYNPKVVKEFVDWHKKTGGVSRFEKFSYFFKEKLGLVDWEAKTSVACKNFGDIVFEGLCQCPFVPGFDKYLSWLESQNIIVSVNTGGAENEIRDVFRRRGLLDKFQVVLGSPSTKYNNMLKLQGMGLLEAGTIYFGDSKLDFDLAQQFNSHFVYVEHESEWPEGKMETKKIGGHVISDFRKP